MLVQDADAVYPLRIDPTFSDEDWISMESGLNGEVYALALSGTALYVGGSFTTAGISPATNIAKWDGSSWSALGSGIQGTDWRTVQALAVSSTNLYAGGRFTTAGGSPATNIAKWDGSGWSPLGSGLSGTNYSYVSSLLVSNMDLYVGGMFTTAGGTPANNIAKWNGSSWSILGSGLWANDPTYAPFVSALAVSGTDLFAGGWFTSAGGSAARCIAKWNGSSWSALGAGLGGGMFQPERADALAVSGSNVYVAGYFRTAGISPAPNIAKWDGSSWSALGAGIQGTYWPTVQALAVSGTNLYAGGRFTAAGGSPATNIAK